MDTKYIQNTKVLSSNTDCNARVGILQALEYFQDNMSDYFFNMQCDGIRLTKTCQAFWVFTKSKIKFDAEINWCDVISMETDICKASPLRLNLANRISVAGNDKIYCLQELCAMDSESRKVRTISSIKDFPQDIEVVQNFTDLEFEKFAFDMGEEDLKSVIKVKSINVDFFGHTNNIEYVKFMLSTLDYSYLKSLNPKTFEVHYVRESREGEELKLYRKDLDSEILFQIKKNDEAITNAKLKY